MAIIANLPYNFTNGTTADASQVMQNFNQIVNNVNTNAAQLALTPQLASENVFTQPQQMSDPTKPAHAVTLGYATNNIGFLGTANTWTKNNVFSGGIDNTPIGQTTPAAGSFTALSSTNANARVRSVSTTNGNNAGFQYSANSPNGTQRAAGVYFSAADTAAASYIGLAPDDNNYALKALQNLNVQVGSGADTGDKFQVYGGLWQNGLHTLVGAPNSGTPADFVVFSRPFNNGVAAAGAAKITLARYTNDATPASRLDFQLFGTNSNYVNAFQIEGTGNVNVPAGGIRLNGGTTALNAYEEGTFTPTIAGSTTAGTPTYTAQSGVYTRVGRLVHFKLYLGISAIGGMAGSVIVKGLPYTSATGANTQESITVGEADYITLTSGNTQFTALLQPGNNYINVNQCGSGISASAVGVSQLNQSGNSFIILSGTYNI